MRALQIRNVPDDVHEVLQRRAAAAGQSMQEYLLALLTEHTSRLTMAEWMELASRQQGGTGVTMDEITAMIRQDRDTR
jgi:plasmid stability protein